MRNDELSFRELEVLELTANGLNNHEVAKKLGISFETIKTHKRNVIAKLGASNSAHAVAIAMCRGLIDPTDIYQR